MSKSILSHTSSRQLRCALCNNKVEVWHFCYGCQYHVCDECAGAANEKPLHKEHALKAHVQSTQR